MGTAPNDVEGVAEHPDFARLAGVLNLDGLVFHFLVTFPPAQPQRPFLVHVSRFQRSEEYAVG
ncbi:MAG: hypothetical protein V3V75_08035 [Thermoguttaceae bacterium]